MQELKQTTALPLSYV